MFCGWRFGYDVEKFIFDNNHASPFLKTGSIFKASAKRIHTFFIYLFHTFFESVVHKNNLRLGESVNLINLEGGSKCSEIPPISICLIQARDLKNGEEPRFI